MSVLVSLIATRDVIHLSLSINWRNDWSAIDENTYDADYDYESQSYVSSSPQGRGTTSLEATYDLFDQILERSANEETQGAANQGRG